MSSVNHNDSDKMYTWVEKKPLTEAVSWTAREKFYLIGALLRFGTDWRCIVQTLKHGGEPYRPSEWYTSKTCERQLKLLINNQSKTVKSLPIRQTLEHIAEHLRIEFIEELRKSNKSYLEKYCSLNDILKRIKQGNLSRNEINSLYSQARRNEIEGKQFLEHLKSRQNSVLASENSSSGSIEEPVKLNAPSAPLLTSLLRSRNTTPSRNNTIISSVVQSPGGTSRTRSGKLLSLSSPVKTTQGTPTLSKLLEAPANPYIPSPSQSSQKNKPNEFVGPDILIGSNSRKENSQSPSLNRIRIDSTTNPGSLNQFMKSDLSYSKRQITRSPSTVKNGSKAVSNVVNLLSDSENEEGNPSQNVYLKNSFGEKKDSIGNNIHRLEPRATRSQTRAEGSFKQLNDSQLSDGKKERSTLRQQNEGSQLTEAHSIDDVLFDIDQIEVEPLSSVSDEIITETPLKITRSSMQRPGTNNPTENLSTSKINKKEINNQMLEEISANFVLNSTIKNVTTEFKNVMGGQSRVDNSNNFTNITGCIVPVDGSTVKDTILFRKEGQSFSNSGNTLTTFDGKLLKQKRIIDLKGANIRCIDGRSDKKILSFSNQPIVVVNKIKKPFNIKLTAELKDKSDFDTKKTIRIHGSSQNMVQLLDNPCSFSDEVIIIDDDVNINIDDSKEFPSKTEFLKLSTKPNVKDGSNVLCNSIPTGHQVDKNITKGDKTWNLIEKSQTILDVSLKKSATQGEVSKIDGNSKETNSRFINKLDFDFDQPTSLSEFYNGVEEIVEMHSFDNEELNSLIECGSLDNCEPEVCQNSTSLNQSNSVSECDSTIEAFDTFAQITKVPQNTISTNIEFVNRESKTVKQDKQNLERSKDIIRINEIDEEQVVTTSVTGIPILQGVISDVMSKIDSDRVASLNKTVVSPSKSINDIVEISSDDDEPLNINEQFSLKHSKPNTSQENDNLKVKQLNNDKLKTIEIVDKNINVEIDKKTIQAEIVIPKEIKYTTTDIKYIKINDNSYKITDIVNIQSKNGSELQENENKEIELRLTESVEVMKKRKEDKLKEVKVKDQIEKALQIDDIKIAKENPLLENKDEKKKEDINPKIMDIEIKVTKPKEFETEIIHKFKNNEEGKIKEVELLKLKESENNKINDIKIDKSNKTKVKDDLLKKTNETEVAKAKEAENPNNITTDAQKESEIQKVQEFVKLQKAKEIEIQHVEDAKRVEAQSIKEAEAKKLKDLELKKEKEFELQKIKEITETRKIKEENELKKTKDIEIALETDINEKKHVSKIMETIPAKIKEVGSKTSITEVSSREVKLNEQLSNEKDVSNFEEQSKKIKRLERLTIEAKKLNVKETKIKEFESEIMKSKELDTKKIVENEIKKSTDLQIVTRNRGLKVEEKLKESNLVLKNVPSSLNKSAGLLVSSLSSSSDNSPISNNDKKQFKNIEDEYKSISSGKNLRPVVDDNVFEKDLNINTNESLVETGGKSRTRSSSLFKQGKISETKPSNVNIHKLNEQVSTTSDNEIKASSFNLLNPVDLSKINFDNRGKKLTVSVVMLSAKDVPILKEKGDQSSDNISVKQSDTKVACNIHLHKSIDSNVKLNKSSPKKRGRKRRIGVSNEQHKQFHNDISTFQNGATDESNTSTNEIDPPAKRTRKSMGSYENSLSLEKRNKKALHVIINNLRNSHKNISILEKSIKDLSPTNYIAIKEPVELQDIEKKINSGEINKLSQLQINLLKLSFNAIMVNKSTSTIFNETSNFQESLYDANLLFITSADESSPKKSILKNINMDDNLDTDEMEDLNFEAIGSSDTDSDDDDKIDDDSMTTYIEYNEIPSTILKSLEVSSDNDSSDADNFCSALSLKRKKKDYTSYNSLDYFNDDDTDDFDSIY